MSNYPRLIYFVNFKSCAGQNSHIEVENPKNKLSKTVPFENYVIYQLTSNCLQFDSPDYFYHWQILKWTPVLNNIHQSYTFKFISLPLITLYQPYLFPMVSLLSHFHCQLFILVISYHPPAIAQVNNNISVGSTLFATDNNSTCTSPSGYFALVSTGQQLNKISSYLLLGLLRYQMKLLFGLQRETIKS